MWVNPSFGEVADMIRRHAGLIRRVVLAAIAYSFLVALSQPVLYRSQETVVFKPTAGDHEADRAADVALAGQMLLSRGSLLRVVDTLHLYGGHPELSADDLAVLLRRSVAIDPLSEGAAGQVVTIRADMPTGLQAVRAAQSLSAEFVRLVAEARSGRLARRLAGLTAREDVLIEESARLVARAASLEMALGSVPTAVQDRLHGIHGEIAALSEVRAGVETALRLGATPEVIAAAALPANPLAGNGTLIVLTGAVAGGLAAVFLAFLLDMRRPALRSAVQMERRTGLVPIACIPNLETAPVRRTLRARMNDWLDGPDPESNSPA